jgi:hypothetical protein
MIIKSKFGTSCALRGFISTFRYLQQQAEVKRRWKALVVLPELIVRLLHVINRL